ncbi:MAG: DUF2066 domain-containing protein [Steroidobacteraceae bacterium]|nr:DUF2066 domain-containing protein [Steroidobacteraceae bacterium]
MTSRPNRCRLIAPCLWLVLLAGAQAWQPASAESLGDLYSVTVPYAGNNEAAFREAMRDVLVRATGRADAPDLEYLAPLVAQASRYVKSFRRSPGGQLAVTFDGPAIENAIDASGLAYWGDERPLTLVWLALDRGAGRRALVHTGAEGEERARVERGASRRGLPIVWPGPGDDLVRSLQQAWSGEHAPLIEAARRYGAEGVLIGRATAAPGGGFATEWTFVAAGLTARSAGELEAGPDLAADRYASLHATRGAARRTEQVVTVMGVASLEDYALAMRTLSRLPPVRGVAVDEVTPDAVSFLVNVRGDPAALAEAIRRDGRLTGVDASRMIFSLRP